jgi:tight adherence protein B
MNSLLIPLLMGVSCATVVVGFLLRARDRQSALDELLDYVRNEVVEDFDDETGTVPEKSVLDLSGFTRNAVTLAGRLVAQVDAQGALAASLERARIPLRAGEYAIVGACASIVSALFVATITQHWLMGVLTFAVAVFGAAKFPAIRIARRRKKLAEQLPDALSLIASSLSAGHTFLRAIQMMCEEADPPLSDEFSRVVYEVRLGAPLVDALERMAERVGLADFKWVVQAIRIQQTVGGRLADLLHTLADFIRARDEVRREVDVLTAEGKFSAYILGAMPVFILLAVQVMSPGYSEPLFHGKGLIALGASCTLVVAGMASILKMVKIEV